MGQQNREIGRERLLSKLPKNAVCAEIGVWKGSFSRKIVDICNPATLHLIDPWLHMPEFFNTGFGRKKNADQMEGFYEGVVDMFKDDPRVVIHRKTSEQALGGLPDGCLDWVYIDGNHNEPYIGTDLALSLQKLKPNGIITGDDFNWQSENSGAPVKQAVEKLVADLGPAAKLRVLANQYVIRLKRAPANAAVVGGESL